MFLRRDEPDSARVVAPPPPDLVERWAISNGDGLTPHRRA
jgi:hypothetical protein